MKTRFLLAAALVSMMALPAAAQTTTPAFEVAGGYSYLRHFNDTVDDTNLNGWFASVAGNLSSGLAIVGEVDGNYKDSLNLYSFMAGPRVASHKNAALTPWVQVLVGGARSSVDGFDVSSTEFALQPGAGVDFWVAPKVGVRVGADYRRIFGDADANEFRFTAGVVLGLGAR